MSEIFPRLDPKLSISTGIEAPTAIKGVEAIKQDIVLKLSQIGLGNQVKAEVIAQLDDGSYIAKVEGMAMRLDLPKGTHIGDQIALRLNRLTPRVSFSLDSAHQASANKPLGNQPSLGDQTISLLPTSSGDLTTMMELQSTMQFSTSRTKFEAHNPNKLTANVKQEIVSKLTQIGLGNSVQAEVIGRLEDGSSTVKVAGMNLRLDLPVGTQVGDKLNLRLNRLGPQISFLYDAPRASTSSANSRTLSGVVQHEILLLAPSSGYQDLDAGVPVYTAGTTNRSTSIVTPHFVTNHSSKAIATYEQEFQNPQSTQTELSSTGQLISHLLGEPDANNHVGLKLPDNRPLIANATIGRLAENLPAMLETQLKKSVTESGFFYESHVVDFLQGKRSYKELSQEPQVQINKNPLEVAEQENLDATKELEIPQLENLTTDNILLDQTDNKHQQLADIVRQQLTILEQNKLVMSGMLAPHMPFSWETFGKDKFDATNQTRDELEEIAPRHHSFLKVELPLLGTVAIHIDLQSNQVQLSMKSTTELAVQELNSHAHQLVQSLELSGTHLQSFKASRDEQT